MKNHKIFTKYYTELAIFFLNTFLLFLFINIMLSVYLNAVSSRNVNSVTKKYGSDLLEKVYQKLNRREMNNLLMETWNRPLVYEPFTQFKEAPFVGKYVNVDKNGFRITKGQGPWPPDYNNFNVFLFGGSTTFGYGVADEQTIPSYLYELISKAINKKVSVYNFGRGFYYSTQERLLFEKLLLSGYIPNIAIFIDGLNDFYTYRELPKFTSQIEKSLNMKGPEIFNKGVSKGPKKSGPLRNFLLELPLGRAAKRLRYQLIGLFDKKTSGVNHEKFKNNSVFKFVINRYVQNKKMIEAISNVYDLKSIFVWQPIPHYKYDKKYYLFSNIDENEYFYYQYGYSHMAQYVKEKPLGDNFLWCADINAEAKETLYVDSVHYTDKMSKKFAHAIFNMTLERKLLNIDI